MNQAINEQWQSLFIEQQNSGLSVTEFCQQRGIKPQAFYNRRWYQKKQLCSDTEQATEFVAVNVMHKVTPSQAVIKLYHGDVVIELPLEVGMSQLSELLNGLHR